MTRRKAWNLEKRSENTWRVRVQRGINLDGSARVIRKTVHGSEADADAAGALLAQSSGKAPLMDTSLTLQTYYQAVFRLGNSIRGVPRSKSTLHWYESSISHVMDQLGAKPIRSITHEQLVQSILTSGSPSNAKVAMRSIMLCAYDDGFLAADPFRKRIPTHREHKIQVEPWTYAEALKGLKTIDRVDLMALCILGLSGLRMEEYL